MLGILSSFIHHRMRGSFTSTITQYLLLLISVATFISCYVISKLSHYHHYGSGAEHIAIQVSQRYIWAASLSYIVHSCTSGCGGNYSVINRMSESSPNTWLQEWSTTSSHGKDSLRSPNSATACTCTTLVSFTSGLHLGTMWSRVVIKWFVSMFSLQSIILSVEQFSAISSRNSSATCSCRCWFPSWPSCWWNPHSFGSYVEQRWRKKWLLSRQINQSLEWGACSCDLKETWRYMQMSSGYNDSVVPCFPCLPHHAQV